MSDRNPYSVRLAGHVSASNPYVLDVPVGVLHTFHIVKGIANTAATATTKSVHGTVFKKKKKKASPASETVR